MKKVQAHKLLYGASLLMVLGFCVHLAVDYYQYSTTLNSAPFSVWILVDSLIWLLPAVLAFAAGLVAKKRMTKKRMHNDNCF
ncbi:MAG: hypothetical protein J6Q53_04560 [Oscillospiraceae bacterium]|nr:hypothetical protein [Oscillospiraceae bacterium]